MMLDAENRPFFYNDNNRLLSRKEKILPGHVNIMPVKVNASYMLITHNYCIDKKHDTT